MVRNMIARNVEKNEQHIKRELRNEFQNARSDNQYSKAPKEQNNTKLEKGNCLVAHNSIKKGEEKQKKRKE